MSRRYQDGRATSFHDTLAVRRPHLPSRKVQANRARTLASADLQRTEGLAMMDTPDRDSVPIPLLLGSPMHATPATAAPGRTATHGPPLAPQPAERRRATHKH